MAYAGFGNELWHGWKQGGPAETVEIFIGSEPLKTFSRNGLIEASHEGVPPNFSFSWADAEKSPLKFFVLPGGTV
jgi:hypothetical protein